VVLEQDRVMLEAMEPDAKLREHLYEHDVGLSRLRRHKQSLAQKQLARPAAEAAAAVPAATAACCGCACDTDVRNSHRAGRAHCGGGRTRPAHGQLDQWLAHRP